MMPMTGSGGVTSKPGFRAVLVGFAIRTYVRFPDLGPGTLRNLPSARTRLRIDHHPEKARARILIRQGYVMAGIVSHNLRSHRAPATQAGRRLDLVAES